MSEQDLNYVVASLGAGDLDIDQFMAAIEEQVNILYPTVSGKVFCGGHSSKSIK